MKKIVAEFRGAGFVNIPGDRLEYDRDLHMVFGYNGKDLVAMFDVDGLVKVHVGETGAPKPNKGERQDKEMEFFMKAFGVGPEEGAPTPI